MNTFTRQERQRIAACFLTFMSNGALALTVGTLMPYVRGAYAFDYLFSGLLVSLHSVGNLSASFLAGLLPLAVGRRKSILTFTACYSLAFLLILFVPWRPVLALAFLMSGLARGAVSNFNNTVVNTVAPGRAWALNALHACFAVGAFLAPLAVLLCTQTLGSWRIMCWVMVGLGAAEWLVYACMPIPDDAVQRAPAGEKNLGFLRKGQFWFTTGTLFFYLCAEQGVIGWMVTYFQDTGIMSAGYAQTMASVLWVLILAGRLTAAWLSSRVDKYTLMVAMGAGMLVFFGVVMLGSSLPVITLGIAGFGFSMAGIYPTTVALSGDIFGKYAVSWSVSLTLASFGSILMPSIVGAVAERYGIALGMATITVAVMITLAVILANFFTHRRACAAP